MATRQVLEVFSLDAAGNTFAGVDWRGRPPLGDAEAAALARRLCAEPGREVDGLLLLEAAPGADFAMHYRNRDGSRAGYCGNGTRAIALLAGLVGAAGTEMRFATDAGFTEARRLGAERFEAAFPDPRTEYRAGALDRRGAPPADFIDTGVPHALVWTDGEPDSGALSLAAAELRWHPGAGAGGANVNLARDSGAGGVRLRTFERGVEAETRACGTGAVAAAIGAAVRAGRSGPQRGAVVPTGGAALEVSFELRGTRACGVCLAGPAVVLGVRRSEWPLEG
ncbi:MAG: diaminopimelate epimerase [Candidatus Sumerlaeia bacterium]|nr:diaminopimelate epimerase [Candidatus Sumerlaeia bacterium]